MKDNDYKSLKQLALDCNVPYTTLKDFYNKNSPDSSRLSTSKVLAKFMGCTLDYLAYDEITEPTMTAPEFAETLQYTKTISDEDGYTVEIKTTLPFEKLPKDEQQEMIDSAMEDLLKAKKEIRQKGE